MSPHTATAGARPEFLTNQPPARTVADQLQQFLQLADRYEQPPPIYIATAYFNQGGWVAVADQLEAHTGRGGEVRLLLGTSPADTPGPNATIVTDRARREAGDLPF